MRPSFSLSGFFGRDNRRHRFGRFAPHDHGCAPPNDTRLKLPAGAASRTWAAGARVCLGLLLLLASTGCATTRWTHGVPNLAGVRTGLWRGGQPSPEGWRYLHGLGVRKVVKLNTKSEASDREAAALGMEIVYLPMSFVAFREPPPETVQAAVDALKVSNQNVYVHCTHGWDRTGLVVGAYRVWVERRPKETAYKEMLERGFRPRFRGLQHFWETRVGP